MATPEEQIKARLREIDQEKAQLEKLLTKILQEKSQTNKEKHG